MSGSVPEAPALPAIALETSQRTGSVALATADGAIRSAAIRAAAHSDDLLPALDRLCRAHDVTPPSIRSVMVNVGPGGFTGLRVGIAAAKLIAEAVGAAVVGVPSALVVAEALRFADREPGAPVLRAVVLLAVKPPAAGRGASAHAGTAWRTCISRPTADAPWAIDALDRGSLVRIDDTGAGAASAIGLGGALVAQAEFLPALAHSATVEGVPWVEPTWSAAACLAAGARRLGAGLADDPIRLLPIYPRPAEAVALWERRAVPG